MKKKYLSMMIASALMTSSATVWAAEVEENGVSAVGQESTINEYLLDDIIVTATRLEERTIDVPANVTVITAKDLEDKNTFSLREMLSEEASIFVNPAAETKDGVSIRGFEGSDILVMYNGQYMNGAFDGAVNFDSFNPEEIERIEIVRGAGSALYGGHAVGGIINIITKKPKNDGNIHVRTNLAYGSNSTWKRGIGISGGDGKFAFTVNYQKNTTGGFKSYHRTADPTKSGTPIGTGNFPMVKGGKYIVGGRGRKEKTNENVSLNLRYDFDDNKTIDYTFMHYKYTYNYRDPYSYAHNAAGESIFDGVVTTQNGNLVKLSANNYLGYIGESDSDLHKLNYEDRANKFKVGIGYRHMYREGYMSSSGATRIDWTGKGARADYPSKSTNFDLQKTWVVGSNTITAGLAWNKDEMNYKSYTLPNWRDGSSWTGISAYSGGITENKAIFVQDEMKLGERWKMYLGARYDRFDKKKGYWFANKAHENLENANDSAISPKISFTFEPKHDMVFFASYGASFNPPTIYQLYRQAGTDMSDIHANPELKPEKSKTIELGMKQKVSDKTSYGLTFFHVKTKDKIALIPKTDPQLVERKYVNMNEAMTKGFELELKHRFNDNWRVFTNYTFQTGDQTSNGARANNYSIPKHLLHFGVGYEIGKFDASLSGTYVSEREEPDSAAGTSVDFREAYFLMNLALKYRFSKNFDLQFGVNNLFDREFYSGDITAGRTYMVTFRSSF